MYLHDKAKSNQYLAFNGQKSMKLREKLGIFYSYVIAELSRLDAQHKYQTPALSIIPSYTTSMLPIRPNSMLPCLSFVDLQCYFQI